MNKKIKIVLGVIVAVAVSAFHGYGQWNLPIYDTKAESATYQNVGEIVGNKVVSQEFFCKVNGLCGFEFRPSSFGRKVKTPVLYRIVDKANGKTAREGSIDTESLIENKKNIIDFEKISDSKNKEYVLEIQDNNAQPNDGITLMTADKNNEQSLLTVAGEVNNGALVAKFHAHYFKIEEFIVFLALIGYVVFFIKFLNRFLR